MEKKIDFTRKRLPVDKGGLVRLAKRRRQLFSAHRRRRRLEILEGACSWNGSLRQVGFVFEISSGKGFRLDVEFSCLLRVTNL